MVRFRLRLVAAAAMLVVLAAATRSQAAAAPLLQDGRPSLPGEQTVGTENFLIHYTLQGQHAVMATDVDSSGVPDYVEQVAETLEHVWQAQITDMKWPMPPPDGGEGGDTRLDVYFEDILSQGYAGYVETLGGYIGDNPNTPQQERRAAYSYMVLDNDYAEVDPALGETPTGLMQATIAHEFNHIIQAGIDDEDLHYWLYEATATWMEDEIYDDINDGVFYLESVMENPDICPVASEARGDDLHWYGEWLFLRMLSERYGSDLIRVIWENIRQFNGFRAIDAALAPYGSTLEDERRDYAIANLLRTYEEADLYPGVRIEGETGVGGYFPPDGVQSLGVDYVRLSGSEPLSVTITETNGPLVVYLIGIRSGEADVLGGDRGPMTIDRGSYDDAYILVYNPERAATESECTFGGYQLSIEAAGAAPSAPLAVWPAGGFANPDDVPGTALSGGSSEYRPPDAPFTGSLDSTTSAADLNVAFTTLLPASLPGNYQFDYAYIMTEEELGASADYYVPGGGDMANFDYLDDVGNWLSIAESPSPYADVTAWMEGISYTDSPGTIRQINGVDVLIEDLSEGSETWYSATLVLDDLFIVVDGDNSEQDVIAMVEGLIAASSASPADTATEQPAAAPTTAPQIAATQPPAVDPPLADTDPAVDNTGLWVLLTSLGLGTCAIGLCIVGGIVPLAAVLLVLRARRRRRDRYPWK